MKFNDIGNSDLCGKHEASASFGKMTNSAFDCGVAIVIIDDTFEKRSSAQGRQLASWRSVAIVQFVCHMPKSSDR
jgi:hypothetical protein